MSSAATKPRRIVAAQRILALGASAAALGTAAGAAPVTPSWTETQSLEQFVASEGEGSAVEAEGEAGHEASAVEAEGDGHAEGEGSAIEGEGEGHAEGEAAGPASGGEGESEGGGSGPAEGVAQARTLLTVGGLLSAAEDLRAEGATDAGELIEEAAEMAEHGLAAPLAEELYEAIETLEDAEGTEGFAPLRERIAAAREDAAVTDRVEALSLALRAAAEEYGEAVSDGAVADRTAYLEAFGIYRAVRAEVEALATSAEAPVAEVAAEMSAQLAEVEPAFDGVSGAEIRTPDASLLHAAAARMELAALKLR